MLSLVDVAALVTTKSGTTRKMVSHTLGPFSTWSLLWQRCTLWWHSRTGISMYLRRKRHLESVWLTSLFLFQTKLHLGNTQFKCCLYVGQNYLQLALCPHLWMVSCGSDCLKWSWIRLNVFVLMTQERPTFASWCLLLQNLKTIRN